MPNFNYLYMIGYSYIYVRACACVRACVLLLFLKFIFIIVVTCKITLLSLDIKTVNYLLKKYFIVFISERVHILLARLKENGGGNYHNCTFVDVFIYKRQDDDI